MLMYRDRGATKWTLAGSLVDVCSLACSSAQVLSHGSPGLVVACKGCGREYLTLASGVSGCKAESVPPEGVYGIHMEPQNDPVNRPSHYTGHPSGVECIQITEHMNFCRGNAIKYIWRAGEKGCEVEDLKKARWYIDREIARLEKISG